MRLVTQKNTTLGEILQAYTLDVLKLVAEMLNRKAEFEPNGSASAKAEFTNEAGDEISYLYLGFDNRGFLLCQYMPYMGTGQPRTIYGPIALAKSVELPISMVARRILSALPDEL